MAAHPQPGQDYAIVNNASQTVLDIMGGPNRIVTCEWHENVATQKWRAVRPQGGASNIRLIRTLEDSGNVNDGPLNLRPTDALVQNNTRLTTHLESACMFLLDGHGDTGYRLLTNINGTFNTDVDANPADAPFAVTVITGQGIGHITNVPGSNPPADDSVENIEDSFAPVVFRHVAPGGNNEFYQQKWYFIPIADMPELPPGIYTIHNNATGTVLDRPIDPAEFFVRSQELNGGLNQQWKVSCFYTMGRFVLECVQPAGGDPVSLRPTGIRLDIAPGQNIVFKIMRVPGTPDYQIFCDHQGGSHAVNVVDGEVVQLPNVAAQTWAFHPVA